MKQSGGYLYLRNTQITSLPSDLTVGGDLYLRNTQITELPSGFNSRLVIYTLEIHK